MDQDAAPGPLDENWAIFGQDHVPYRLLLTARLIDRLTAGHVRALADLTLAEWRVLAHLAVMGERSASTLSAAALVDRSEVSRAVAALLARGLIARRPNPRNRRSHLLSLTGDGTALVAEVQRERRRFFTDVTADLRPDELAALDGMLLRIARRAGAIEQAGTLTAPPGSATG